MNVCVISLICEDSEYHYVIACLDQEETLNDQCPVSQEAVCASRHWLEYQAGQQIFLQTPSVLVGFRVEVYRTEGTTQWYTAVIKSYNENTRVSEELLIACRKTTHS